MASKQQTSRHYHLTCRRCQRTWTATYEVVTYHDLDADQELFFLHGVPVAPPWAGIACPHCGGLRVTILPGTASASCVSNQASPVRTDDPPRSRAAGSGGMAGRTGTGNAGRALPE
jgi:hypothetical protein